ncbi:MAG TPA: RcnB family protein [Candidimonas sp.]|nr:RcnB family protein [Candidimonas sp.]
MLLTTIGASSLDAPNTMSINNKHIITAAIIALFAIGSPAIAEKPDHAGGNGKKGNGHAQNTQRGQPSKSYQKAPTTKHRQDSGVSININFDTRQRAYLHDYYRGEFTRGNCPPGLAKKNNGCMPPGQAKKWRKGYPLDRDVVYYDLPSSVLIELGQPPRGYKYVRVAADILMIAIGSGMVIDAVADLASM